MKVLVFGGNGWIGSQLLDFFNDNNVDYIKSKHRADDIDAVLEELRQGEFTHVLSLIGRTSGVYKGEAINTIDFLEKPGGLLLNMRDNLFSPTALAIACKQLGIHFTYFGTGCIFEYDIEHTPTENGWRETDKPNFFGSGYSTVKGFTDRIMHLLDDTVLNLRIRMPITANNHRRNFITKITSYEKICSIPNSMTVLETFFPVIMDLMQKSSTGTFNCTNPGVISHNEILQMYKDLVDPNFVWKNFTLEEQAEILLSGRSNNFLNTEKLQHYNIPDIHSAVRQTLLKYRR